VHEQVEVIASIAIVCGTSGRKRDDAPASVDGGNRLGSIQPVSGSLLSRVMIPLSRSNTNTSESSYDQCGSDIQMIEGSW